LGDPQGVDEIRQADVKPLSAEAVTHVHVHGEAFVAGRHRNLHTGPEGGSAFPLICAERERERERVIHQSLYTSDLRASQWTFTIV